MIKLVNEEDCTGCFACMNACRCNAITVNRDKLGKTIPKIENKKCVECGTCVKVCPVLKKSNLHEPIKVMAASWNVPMAGRIKCASGGVASGFSKYIVENKGVVFGVRMDSSCRATHIKGTCESDVESFKGSKYVQSFIGYTYREAKECLDDGNMVLYIGTPCQIDGLKNFLNRKYSNLITVDLICHGTPPDKYLTEHIKALTKENIEKIKFRGNEDDFQLILSSKDDIIYQKAAALDKYYLAFLDGLIYRDNCYRCRYASCKRCSDITIGDFWGLDKHTLKNEYNGNISVILVNTESGLEFWNKVEKNFISEERNLKEAVAGNEQLRGPARASKGREIFERTYVRYGFHKALRKAGVDRQIFKSRIAKNCVVKKLIEVRDNIRRIAK